MILMISSGWRLSSEGALSLPLEESPQFFISTPLFLSSSIRACRRIPLPIWRSSLLFNCHLILLTTISWRTAIKFNG
jgi:hypothetical protein